MLLSEKYLLFRVLFINECTVRVCVLLEWLGRTMCLNTLNTHIGMNIVWIMCKNVYKFKLPLL